MRKNKKKGFTLVELLAVIVVLAIILVIAVPKILDVIKSSRENSLISSVKLIARNAEQKKLANEVLGEDEEFDCSEVADLSENDYQSCTINFDEEGNAIVSITGKGKFNGMNVCNGTKNSATITDEECGTAMSAVYCTYNGELTKGAEFQQGIYTYRYNQESNGEEWIDMENNNGWGVILTDPTINIINELPCTYINDIPITSMAYTYSYYESNVNAPVVMNNSLVNDDLKLTNLNMSYIENELEISKEYNLIGLNTSNVTNMEGMFAGNETIKNIPGIENFDTSNVTNMIGMFYECNELEELDLGNWDTSKVTNMYRMFQSVGHESTLLELIGLDNWDVSDVIDMQFMFAGVGVNASTFSLNLSDWDINKEARLYYMFLGTGSAAQNFELNLSSWDIYNNEYNADMLSSAGRNSEYFKLVLQDLDIQSGYSFLYKIFNNYGEYVGNEAQTFELDLSGWDTSDVTDMRMFEFTSFECLRSPIVKLNLSGWDTSNVTSMQHMFYGGLNTDTLLEITGLDTWNTSNVTDMYGMFDGCRNLVSLDLSSWDTSNVITMENMFRGCINLEHIYVGENWTVSSIDINDIIFSGCEKLPNYMLDTYNINDYNKEKAYVGGYLECKEGHTCTCTYSGC